MARRNDIDWEAVERDYRAGLMTVAAVAKKHGVSESQVRAKAKSEGWTRDLSAAIDQRTKAKIAAIDVASIVEQSARESAGKSAALIKDAIEQASDVAAGIVIKHRAGLRLDMERANAVSSMLENAMSQAEGIKDIVSVTQALKNLAEIGCKLRDQERVIYGLDKGATDGDDALAKSRIAIEFVSAAPKADSE